MLPNIGLIELNGTIATVRWAPIIVAIGALKRGIAWHENCPCLDQRFASMGNY
jgi:hypothetical protein